MIEYNIVIEKMPSIDSSIQAVLIGIFIPLISSIMPIRTALARNLAENLDNQRAKN